LVCSSLQTGVPIIRKESRDFACRVIYTRLGPHCEHRHKRIPGLSDDNAPFWQTKTLDQMDQAEWESLCDGCGRCCLVKLEDDDTSEIHLTRLSCRLLDVGSCRCSDYANRQAKVPDCIAIDPEKVRTLSWLPPTCGYRLVDEGKGLQWWHPLVSGSPETVHEAGISVRGWALSEARIKPDSMHRYIIKDFRVRD
jgi:uncharacterized protein